MKAPSLSKTAMQKWFLNHFEKILAACVFLFSCWLAWGGLTAIQSKSASADLKPDIISSRAAAALQHIDQQKNPPEEKLLEPLGLSDRWALWKSPKEKASRRLVLSHPLFEEKERRTKPEVFPVEELQAVSGIAALAKRPEPETTRPRRPTTSAFEDMLGGDMGMGIEPSDPAESVPPARIIPYVMVHGLIPYAKQSNDYYERFGNASFQDARRDIPLWSDFLIERADVTNGTSDKWQRIIPKTVMDSAEKTWAGIQPDSLPADFFLAPEQQPALGNVRYAWPLPQLALESWGMEAFHPWALTEWERLREEQEAMMNAAQEAPTGFGLSSGLGMGDSYMDDGSGLAGSGGPALPFENPLQAGGDDYGDDYGMESYGMMGEEGAFDPASLIEYKLFRFVDTDVKLGRSYKYRVRVSLWNPNYNVPAQHLLSADLATATKLPSGHSNETSPVSIPSPTGVLARTLPDNKAVKSALGRDKAEVLILLPNEKTGNFALHSNLVIPGNMISVQKVLEPEEEERKPGGQRTPPRKKKPEIISIPVGFFIDFMGQQIVADLAQNPQLPNMPRRSRKLSPPKEPFELLMLGDDGELRIASPAGSEERFGLYMSTLPPELRGVASQPEMIMDEYGDYFDSGAMEGGD